MPGGRRELLGAVAGLVGIGAGRSVAGDARPVPPDDTSGSGDSGESSDGQRRGREPRSADRSTRQLTQQPGRNEPLADRTAAVVAEIDWFAREYPSAIQTYQAAMRRGARRAERLRNSGGVTPTQAQSLQTTFDGIVQTVRGALAPHFPIHRGIRERTETHTATVLRFARRNDTDRVNEELQRLAAFSAGYASDVFVAESLSRVPVLNRLIEQLRAGPFDRRRPLLFRVLHDTAGFRSYAYQLQSFGRYDLFKPGYNGGFIDRFDELFLAVDAPARRTDRYYLSVFEGEGPVERPFDSRAPVPGRNQIISIQQYPDAAAAAGAYQRVRDRDGIRLDQFREEPYRLGDSRWDRVYYPFEGDVLYTLVTTAGRFLLTIGPGRTAWEERLGWDRLLDRTFLSGA